MQIRKNSKSGINDVVIELNNLSGQAPDNIFGLLPDELMLHIIRHVPHDSLFSALRKVNRRFHALCDNYLSHDHQPATIRWRLRFFRDRHEDLQEDIEEESERYGCGSSVLLLVIGAVLTFAVGIKSNHVLHEPDATSSRRALFAVLMLASLMLLVLGIIRTGKYWQSTIKTHAMYQQIDNINENIEINLTKLNATQKSRNPV